MVLHLLTNEKINVNKNGLIGWHLFAFHKNSLVAFTQHLSGRVLVEFASLSKPFQDSEAKEIGNFDMCVLKENGFAVLNNPATVLNRQ